MARSWAGGVLSSPRRAGRVCSRDSPRWRRGCQSFRTYGLLSELADDRRDREGEKREEEVHDVLICLSKQHAIFLGVDKELHAKRGGGCHSSQRSQLSFFKENIWLLENSDNLTQSNGHHVHNQDVYI